MLTTDRTAATDRLGGSQHSHYSRDVFFRFDAGGSVRDWSGERNLLVSEDFIIALQRGLEQEAGPASGMLMYALGLQWGTRDLDHFRRWFEPEYKVTVEQANPKFMLETWWWPFASQGWGKWELESPSGGYMVVNLYDSAVAKALGRVGKPVCHLYAGLFAGFFSAALARPLSGIEIQCYGMGESHCRFLIGNQERMDAAEFWLGNGVTAKEITRLLEQGEKQ